MLQLAAAVERQATHPVAKALVAAAAADRAANASSSSGVQADNGLDEQQQLLERRASHATAGSSASSSSSSESKHHFWQHRHGSKGTSSSSSSSFLSPEAAAVLAAGGKLESQSGTFLQEPGSGAVAVVSGHKVSVGTLEWVQRHGAQLVPAGEQQLQTGSSSARSSSEHDPLTGHTQVYVGVDDMVVGLVDVADVIRPDARRTIQELHEQGIATIMLSGERA